jgi:hypothetical protein
MTGTVLSICTSTRKGHSKAPVERARVIAALYASVGHD